MKEKVKTGCPISDAVTNKKIKQFIDEILTYNNGATFQRRVGSKYIVRATFKVHASINGTYAPVYTLTYSDDNNCARSLIDVRVYRENNLHYVIQDFKRTISDYMCVLAK